MKIFKLLLTLFHLGILVLLLATALNSVLSPERCKYLNLISLLFPVLMILNIILCFFWILSRKKRALFFLASSLLLINPTKRWINWTSESKNIPNLKIVTFNIKGGKNNREGIYDYLEKSGADLLLGQEFGPEFNVPNYENRINDHSVVAINSKIKLIDTKDLHIGGIGNAIYADVEINGQIIRIFNVYLNPFMFDKKKLKPSESLEKNEGKVKYAFKTLIPNFKIHQREIAAVRKEIEASPYPVIVAGDFNSVPNSYEYYELGKDLTDAFVEVGRGSSTSFHDYKFPIRIDYVFVSKEIKPIRYQVDRSVKSSDHFPVIAEFKIE